MCGIVGMASTVAIRDRSALARARDLMSHRGPDDHGEWWSPEGRVGLGHRRLAIIDLSAAGHQPMSDAAGDLVITFNGEIYNFLSLRQDLEARGHQFRSHSDTEIILAGYREWGADILTRLEGMFAFALYDRRTDEILLARDRAGEKPLFYAIVDGVLIFASEAKALLSCAPSLRRVDLQALDCYLGIGYVPGDRSILAGVSKLPAAHAMVCSLRALQFRTWQYWRLPEEPAEAASAHLTSLAGELEGLLERAVAKQLVSDVPVGVLLSGGIDSSVIVAMAARAVSKLSTFTIRFPGHAGLDETEHARRIARHFGTQHVELSASEARPDLLPRLARQYDEPLIDSSMIPTFLVSELVRQRCTVALGGDGGDELFGGYQHYPRLVTLARWARWMPELLRAAAGAAANGLLPIGTKGRNWGAALAADFNSSVPQIASYFDRGTRVRLVPALREVHQTAEHVWASRVAAGRSLVDRATRTDFANFLPDDILVKVDRASMLSSLEVRAPFLDPAVVEFAFGRVPAALKVGPAGRKILLNELAGKVLPANIDRARKQGFVIPLASWLRSGPWVDLFRSVLLDTQSAFDRAEVARLWAGQQRGRQNSERLFGLVMFELWRREYGVEMSWGLKAHAA